MNSAFYISVVIPAYNAEKYLREAIQSVLAQSRPPDEVIIVDDGSADGTATVAQSFGGVVHYLARPHEGLAATLNSGLSLAQGNLLAFLDADDVWLPDKLERQLAALQAQPQLDMVFGYAEYFRGPGLEPGAAGSYRIPLKPVPAYSKSAMLTRRQAFLRNGAFDTRWRVGDFVDWYARALDAGLKALMLPSVVFRRRVHDANMTSLQRADQLDYVRILKLTLDRRRSMRPGHTL